MSSIAARIIVGRLQEQNCELETRMNVTGQVFQSLPLSLGHTTIQREVLPDGSPGDVRICTREARAAFGSSSVYGRYLLKEDGIVYDPAYDAAQHGGHVTVPRLRVAALVAKVMFGRVDHRYREGGFHDVNKISPLP